MPVLSEGGWNIDYIEAGKGLDFPQKSRQGQAQSFRFCFSYSAGQR
jgi:hypothetical protein